MPISPRLEGADRTSLLLGTALASTLLIGGILAPAPAHAVVNCPPGAAPLIYTGQTDNIVCENDDPRDGGGGAAIDLSTTGGSFFIEVRNYAAGTLTGANGIVTETDTDGSPIFIDNAAEIVTSVRGIDALTTGTNSAIDIVNSGALLTGEGIRARAENSGIAVTNYASITAELGIYTLSDGTNSNIVIKNYGPISASDFNGIDSYAAGLDSDITVINTGSIEASGDALLLRTYDFDSSVTVDNFGFLDAGGTGIAVQTIRDGSFIDIDSLGRIEAYTGIDATTGSAAYAGITIRNRGDIVSTDQNLSGTILADTNGTESFITIINSGEITSASGGIDARAYGLDSDILITNRGAIATEIYGALFAKTGGNNSTVTVINQGDLVAARYGIFAYTEGTESSIAIESGGGVRATSAGGAAYGIFARTFEYDSPIAIENSGDIQATAQRAYGIYARTGPNAIFGNTEDSPIAIRNGGDIAATGTGVDSFAAGIFARSQSLDGPVSIENDGDIRAYAGNGGARGIHATTRLNSSIGIVNSGDITARGREDSFGIYTFLYNAFTPVLTLSIENDGDIRATSTGLSASGIQAIMTNQRLAPTVIDIVNRGDIWVSAPNGYARGIYATRFSPIDIANSGDLTISGATSYGIQVHSNIGGAIGIANYGDMDVEAERNAFAIRVTNRDAASDIGIENSGDLRVRAGEAAYGIFARSDPIFFNAPISIVNNGDMAITGAGKAYGIFAILDAAGAASISIENRGDIAASGTDYAYGIRARSEEGGSDIVIINAGDIRTTGKTNYGVHALTTAYYSDIVVQNFGRIEARGSGVGILIESNYADALVQNYGDIVGGDLGILVEGGGTEVGVINHGTITADTLFAIELIPGGGYGAIVNYGVITGYIEVFGLNNEFVFNNEPGGLFEARLTSLFGGGGFFNFEGATVHTAADPSVPETTVFSGISLFDNKGLISMVDGAPGDTFQLTGSAYGYYSVSFNGSGDSTLAIDAFLGGPGSTSDILIVDGDVTGRTALQVNNTNAGPGVNGAVIPVVEIGGNVKSDAFFLPQPIDTGFFDYDLFFRPTGSGVFELRSFPGGGALLLPQLITGAQDIWHQGSSTWFDRTADLRVLLVGGATPIAYNPNGGYADGAVQGTAMTPAVWARGGGAWLDRDGSGSTSAFGRTYNFNLDRDLEIIDWQMGLDLGKRDLFSQGDILVFGVLGGFVGADLDYNQLARNFDFSGGQVGGYATYLNGGLFVDTLLNAHLLELETRTLGFANSLDANTLGLRTDTGYRFGSFSGGAFIEPLATIAVLWSDIDGFSRGGNTVSFDDEANVRGRLGVRVGTSYPIWGTTTVEPFVIGSLWGNLSGDNQATLVSTGTTFRFEDDLDDMWGEVSAGVNFFNPSASTAVFAKLDVTFGDDVEGIGGKAGMRVSW